MATKSLSSVVQQIIKNAVESKGFDRHLKKVRVLSAENGKCYAELTVEPEMINPVGTLHGAFQALIVDNTTSLALLTHPKSPPLGVSVDLSTQFFKGAVVGSELAIHAKTLRIGKNLAFSELTIAEKDTGELISKGTQTKYIGG